MGRKNQIQSSATKTMDSTFTKKIEKNYKAVDENLKKRKRI